MPVQGLQLQPRLAIAFTCGVCGARNLKMFSRRSYEHGVVVIRCDGEPSLTRAPAAQMPPLTHVLALLRLQQESLDC